MLTEILRGVTEKGPLVHAITNQITSNDCANVILACGAYPTMAESVEEVEEITSNADSLVLNLGNPTPERIRSMLLAGKAANRKGIPVVLDPVGVGASRFRRQAVGELLQELRISVVRGNASEIRTLSGSEGCARGVDAARADAMTEENLPEWITLVKPLSERLHAVVVISGEIDLAVGEGMCCVIRNGHPMMSKVTGTGCMLSALTGAYCGGNPHAVLHAAVTAAGVMGASGQHAAARIVKEGAGTASFRVALIDAISNAKQRMREEEIHIEYY